MNRIHKYLQLPEWSDKRQHYNGEVLPSAEHRWIDSNQGNDKCGAAETKATNARQTSVEMAGSEIVEEAGR